MSIEYMPRARAAAIAEIRELMATWNLKPEDLFAPELTKQPPRGQTRQAPPPQHRATAKPAAPAPAAPPPAAPVVTVAPPRRFDPRYQCDPAQPVDGAGFMSDWQRRRSNAEA